MMETTTLFPGVTLRCHHDSRFKQGCLSLQLVRPMCSSEASANALLGSVLLRGTKAYPNLRAITQQLDDLYGASVSTLVRRIGDYQTTGLYCAFIEDRFALQGDQILQPMVDFLSQLLFHPVMENGGFCADYVESEKKNLISAIESERNDKRVYASNQLLKLMCREDSYGIPRLGSVEQVGSIDARSLYDHSRMLLQQSPIALFYVGSQPMDAVAQLLRPLFSQLERSPSALPEQTGFHDAGTADRTEQMELAQSQLYLGFVSPITNRDSDFAAMQVLNTLFGAGMTSKLFMNVREKRSLCYSIGSTYYGSKGIITVGAGIDAAQEELTRQEILQQLEDCRNGNITPAELESARQAIVSGLLGIHDSPGSIEGYYSTSILSGMDLTPQAYRAAVEAVTLDDVVRAAQSLQLHTRYFLEGVGV